MAGLLELQMKQASRGYSAGCLERCQSAVCIMTLHDITPSITISGLRRSTSDTIMTRLFSMQTQACVCSRLLGAAAHRHGPPPASGTPQTLRVPLKHSAPVPAPPAWQARVGMAQNACNLQPREHKNCVFGLAWQARGQDSIYTNTDSFGSTRNFVRHPATRHDLGIRCGMLAVQSDLYPQVSTSQVLGTRKGSMPGQDELQHDLLPGRAVGFSHKHGRALHSIIWLAAACAAWPDWLRHRDPALSLTIPLSELWSSCSEAIVRLKCQVSEL